MKTSKNSIIQLLIFIVLVLYYFVSICFSDYNKILNSSILLGVFSGFYFLNNQKIKKIHSIIVLLSITAIGILLQSCLSGGRMFNFLFSIIIPFAFVAVPTCIFYGVSKIPVKKTYLEAVVFATIICFINGITILFGKGTQTAANVVLWILAASYLIDKEEVKKWIPLVIFIAASLILYFIFSDLVSFIFNFAIASISVFIVFTILSSCLNTKRSTKIIIVAAVTVFMAILSWFGEENTRNYIFAHLNDSKYEYTVKEPYSIDYQVVTLQGDTLNQESLKGKNIVILFWSARCAHCPEEFPYFSDLANEYLNDTSIVFLSLYISTRDKDTAYYNEVTKTKYAFQWAIVLDGKKLMKDLNFNAFPRMTIINKEGLVVYNGLVSNRPWIFVNNPRKFVGNR